jgi:hypothetical protein
MYVTQSNACTVPNGSTPVSKAKIAAGQLTLSRLNTKATAAQQAFTALLCRQDLNTNGWPVLEYGGTPSSCGTEGALPIGGNSSGIETWPPQLIFLPTPAGIAPTTLQAYAAPPAPQIPSLVTQGHSRYVPPSKRGKGTRPAPAAASVPAPVAAPAQTPVCSQYPYASAAYINCVEALEQSGHELTTSSQTFGSVYNKGVSGLGCADSGSTCDFLTGMISAIGLGAAMLYLFDYLKRSGRITF